MNKKQIALNLIGQVLSLVVGLCVSLLLTPFIVSNLGKEAYGYVGLANNFIGYFSIVTTALTGMLSRYVTVEYSKKNYDKASGYFSTAYFTEILIALILVLPTAILVSKMDSIFEMSTGIVVDVKILWALTFTSFLLGLSFGGFGSGVFAKNRLDITAILNIINRGLYAGILLITFVFFTPKVWYIGLATIVSNIVNISLTYIAQRKVAPEIILNIKFFNKKYIYDLVIVGIWNSIGRLQQLLITGLDLLLTNIFINGGEMGLLSIAKALPSQVAGFTNIVSGTFDPTMTISYGKGKKEDFIYQTKFAMKFTGFLCAVPILGVIFFGINFYELWQPSLTQDEIMKVQILAILTMLQEVFAVYVYPLATVFTITTKLRVPTLVNLGIGILNVIIVFILLKTTNLGVYAIAGVSSVLWSIKILTFTPLYASHVICERKSTFFKPLMRGTINIITVGGFMFFVSRYFHSDNWIGFILIAGVTGILSYILSFLVQFSNEEKKEVVKLIKSKVDSKINRKAKNN